MTEKNNGGPAFPGTAIMDVPVHGHPDTGETTSWERKRHEFSGMTLRDWFAGQALVGLLSNPAFVDGIIFKGKKVKFGEMSYITADAMLSERDKP